MKLYITENNSLNFTVIGEKQDKLKSFFDSIESEIPTNIKILYLKKLKNNNYKELDDFELIENNTSIDEYMNINDIFNNNIIHVERKNNTIETYYLEIDGNSKLFIRTNIKIIQKRYKGDNINLIEYFNYKNEHDFKKDILNFMIDKFYPMEMSMNSKVRLCSYQFYHEMIIKYNEDTDQIIINIKTCPEFTTNCFDTERKFMDTGNNFIKWKNEKLI